MDAEEVERENVLRRAAFRREAEAARVGLTIAMEMCYPAVAAATSFVAGDVCGSCAVSQARRQATLDNAAVVLEQMRGREAAKTAESALVYQEREELMREQLRRGERWHQTPLQSPRIDSLRLCLTDLGAC